MQAILGTLRWYNSSEESLENLQKYPIYSASEERKTSTIRVNIAPKPQKSEVYVFVPTLKNNPVNLIPTENPDISDSTATPQAIPLFKTPVIVSHTPLDAEVPDTYVATID